MNQASSVGIIGGADGPTAIFVSSQYPLVALFFGGCVILAFGVLIALYFRRR